jgi:hypothetical protein
MAKNTTLSYKERRAILKQVNDLAWLLDNSIHIPLINYRIGLDAIIGLIPGLGDVAGLLLSSIIVLQAVRLGVPRATLARLVLNIAIEAGVGIIPIVGDLFDARFKANALNVQLINQAVNEIDLGRTTRQSTDQAFVALIVGALAGLISVIGGMGIALFSWVFSRLRSKT